MKPKWMLMIIAAALALAACAPLAGSKSEQTKMEYGEGATVEKIDLLALESFPVQINAALSGYLSDGCTEIERVEQERRENALELKVITRRPKDAICTMQLAPFEESVALEVKGLPAGEYVVRVGEVEASFTLNADNILKSE